MRCLLNRAILVLFLVFIASSDAKCPSSVNGQEVCEEKQIFSDDFNDLSDERWTHEIRLSDFPDFEFNYYNKSEKTAFIKNGVLHIRPVIWNPANSNNALFEGSLELNRYPPAPALCTNPVAKSCSKRGQNGFRMLPPVASSRILSKTRFRYGSVKIRAKMPIGDWIYSQIELTPRSQRYGKNSGKIVIALTRGNMDLKLQSREDLGFSLVEAGILTGPYNTRKKSTFMSTTSSSGWADNFHEYRLEWKPGDLFTDAFAFYVDNRLIGQRIKLPPFGFLPWADTKMAPFDEEMVISLAVGVGGITVFPDNALNRGRLKPWKNLSPKGMYNFWKARGDWSSTWQQDKIDLQIDYVKVNSLRNV